MKTVKLTKGKEAIVDDDFEHLLGYKWSYQDPNKRPNGYAITGALDRKNISMHHCIIGRPLNRKMMIDHINGNTLDNRRENLRIVTSRDNNLNRDIHRSGKIVGVYFDRGRWQSVLTINRKNIYIGSFETKEAAFEARKKAKLEV